LLATIRHGGVNVIKNLAIALLLAATPLIVLAGTPVLHSRSALVYDIRDQEVLLEVSRYSAACRLVDQADDSHGRAG
jgi:hypothetical protein